MAAPLRIFGLDIFDPGLFGTGFDQFSVILLFYDQYLWPHLLYFNGEL